MQAYKDTYPIAWEQFDVPRGEPLHMADVDDGERDTDRTTVRTYVPAYQKTNWEEHAEALDMSLSEYVRAMVQAGRSGFEDGGDRIRPEPSPEDATPGVQGVKTTILEALSEGPQDWEELVEIVAGDVEERLDEALGTLQEEGRVRYSGRRGGYEVVE